MMPPVAQMSMPLNASQMLPSQMLPIAQPLQSGLQLPPVNNTLSENDVLRVALKVKAIMHEEIDKLVTLKVKATTEMKSDIQSLKDENEKLRLQMKRLDTTCKSSVDVLEQCSRRSCLRISGIAENQNENTCQTCWCGGPPR